MMEQVDKPYLKRFFDKNNYLFKVGAPGNLAGQPVVDANCDPYEDRDSTVFFNTNFCVIGVEKSDPDSAEEWLGTANYLNPNFVNTEINKKDENIIEGLNIKYVGYVLAVLLIETPPSKYGKVGFDLPI